MRKVPGILLGSMGNYRGDLPDPSMMYGPMSENSSRRSTCSLHEHTPPSQCRRAIASYFR